MTSPGLFLIFGLMFYTLYYSFREIRAALPVRLQQPQEQRYPALQVHAGSIRVSVIHRTLTWTVILWRDFNVVRRS